MVQNYNNQTITSNTTVSITANSIFVNAASNNITITLPAITANGIPFMFTRIDSSSNIVNVGSHILDPLSMLRIISYDNDWIKLPQTNTLKSYQLMCNSGGTAMGNTIGDTRILTPNGIPPPSVTPGIFMISQAGTISDLYISMLGYGSGTVRFDVYKNDVVQPLTLLASSASAANTINSFTVVPGDRLYITYTNTTALTGTIYLSATICFNL